MQAFLYGDPASTLALLFLLMAVALLWVELRGRASLFAFGAFLYAADVAGRFTTEAWIVVLVLFFGTLALVTTGENRARRGALVVGMAALYSALVLHALPGFRNWKLTVVQLAPEAAPYALWASFDKALVGFFLLLWEVPRAKTRFDWAEALRIAARWGIPAFFVVGVVAFATGYVCWQPKWPPFLPLWMGLNLFITCATEEALFRGFLQRRLEVFWLRQKAGWMWAIGFAALASGLFHWQGGARAVVLATAAGLFCGGAYRRSGKIETAILLHFFLNLAHLLLFTYPALR